MRLHFSVLIQHPAMPIAAHTAAHVMLPREACMMICGRLNPTITVANVISRRITGSGFGCSGTSGLLIGFFWSGVAELDRYPSRFWTSCGGP